MIGRSAPAPGPLHAEDGLPARQRVSQRIAGPCAYFRRLTAAFRRAGDAAGSRERRVYDIGGVRVGLDFAGPALVPALTPALAHLRVTGASAEFEVLLWDSSSTGVDLPPTPWKRHDCVARGEVRGYNDGRFFTAHQHVPRAVNMFDLETRRALFWTADADELPYYEKAAPLRMILSWLAAARARQFVHGAAVGTDDGAVLLAGKGGSGKSTTALACLDAGLRYLGDDYVLLDDGPRAHVHSLYGTAKLEAEQVRSMPRLLRLVTNRDRLAEEKALIPVNQHFAGRLSRRLPVRAVLLPTVTGGAATRARPASSAASLGALAPSTIYQLPLAGRDAFEYLARFVARTPAYALELGTDLPGVAETVRCLLERLQSQ